MRVNQRQRAGPSSAPASAPPTAAPMFASILGERQQHQHRARSRRRPAGRSRGRRRGARRAGRPPARRTAGRAPRRSRPSRARRRCRTSSGGVSSVTASAAPAAPDSTNASTTATGAEAALEQRAEDARPARSATNGVAELVPVQEGRDEPAPDLVVRRDLDARPTSVRDPGPRLGARTTSIAITQTRISPNVAYGRVSGAMPAISSARRRGSLRARRRRRWAGSPSGAVDLRRPLADPLPAVRALGHVRAHLGAAVLADDEQVRLRHGLPQSTRRAEPVRRLLAGGLGRLGHRRVEDLAHHLAEVVVGLVDHAPAATRRCRCRGCPRGSRSPPRSPAPRRAGAGASISRRVSSGTGTRSCVGRSTSCASSPWRAASHLFSSSIS